MKHLLGSFLQAFLVDHLRLQKGMSPASIRSYRDVLRLFLKFVASGMRRRLTRVSLHDLTLERVLAFLRHLEEERGNHIRTRNQRLAVLHTFFEYIGGREPEMLLVAEQVAAVPVKRAPPPRTQFLDREEVEELFASLPQIGRHALRNRNLILFLYNTGARVQEVADLRWGHVKLDDMPLVQLHGKGDKWRSCPLWKDTAHQLKLLHEQRRATEALPESPVFTADTGKPLTRFGIYKIVRRLTAALDGKKLEITQTHISPHVFRHTTAMHLLESGVEVNVIRGWLGHVSLDTTNRYAEIGIRTKEAALHLCEPPSTTSEAFPAKPVWRDDDDLLAWLNSL